MKHTTFTLVGGMLLSGVCGAAAAQSNVSVYGMVDAGVAYSSNQKGNSNTYLRSGSKDGARLGFKGTEDLGNGLKALFQLEAGFNLDDGTAAQSGSLFNRAAFVGLSDKRLGTLTAGRQYAPYFTFLNPLGPVPVVTGATGAHPGDIDGFDITVRNNNSIKYMSPEWRGAAFGLMVASGEQAGHQGSGSAMSAALKYDVANWRYALGYQVLKNGPLQATWDPSSSSSFSKSPINTGYLSAREVQYLAAAVHYQQGALGLGGSLSNVQYRPNASSRFADTAIFNTAAVRSTWQTGTPWLLGAGYAYTRATSANGISDRASYRQLSLMQSYWLSKRTVIYILEANQKARGKTLASNGVTQIDAVAVVGDSQVGTPSSNGSQNVFTVGLRHSF
ncbi:porin [Janthinobacterium aquaticum]|uniref:porin n=1 Tax=Janthinobacterium sp. FT58W TaxID=2654254 RepID=UPI0012640834|nr:porin [Janthinobacterium sp. FT58W]KAB8038482.1 porin [Janthinobacterium sp. FT58W]